MLNSNKHDMKNSSSGFTTLQEWLSYCEQLHTKGIDLGLDRAQRVHDVLGLGFKCPTIVVAGTNGKGSTCAMLESILSCAGYRVGVFTSPHLIYFEERCRINGQVVTEADFVPHFAAVQAAREQAGNISLSYFEFTTLAILHFMSQQKLDAAVLEVGLGGRLDAVNIIDSDCAVITCIGIDHIEYLGSDRNGIGFEKAGIMRAHKPVVSGDPVPPESIAKYALEIGADLQQFGKDFKIKVGDSSWSWFGRKMKFEELPKPSLQGSNQFLNAAGVLAVLEALQDKLPVQVEHVHKGLTNTVLAGRFQTIAQKPTVILDVGHNPHAAKALVENLKGMEGSYSKTFAVFGGMHDKDLQGVLEIMAPCVDRWFFTDLPLPRAISATDLEILWKDMCGKLKFTVESKSYQTPFRALQEACQEVGEDGRVIVFGSFFTVGGVLEHIAHNPTREEDSRLVFCK